MSVNINNWVVATTNSVDGTVNGLSYDQQQGALVQTLLQNGSTLAPGSTQSNAISFSVSANASYSTQSTFNVFTGVSTPLVSTAIGDNSAYAQSSIASYLAYPGQLAFNLPIYPAVDGDLTAIVTGNSFTVFVIATGKVLISGTLPHPPRGVALASNMVYFTMPDSNSLVSLPIALPQTQ